MTKREEYTAKLKKELDKWSARIDQWDSKAKNANAAMHSHYQDEKVSLRQHADKVKELLAALESSSADAWEGVQKKADEALESLKKVFEKADKHHD